MSRTVVVYKDFATGAAYDSSVSVTGQTGISRPELLLMNVTAESIITLEPNSWRLDGSRSAYIYSDGTDNVPYWSELMSDAQGRFQARPTITIQLGKPYASSGIGINGWAPLGEWCNEVGIKWYRDGTLLAQKTFNPDGPEYFCSNFVDGYNKVVITLYRTNLPYRRAKISHIGFGVQRKFTMDEIRDPQIVNQSSMTCRRLPASTFDFVLRDIRNAEYHFQNQQAVEVWNGSNKIGDYYVATSRRKNDMYKVHCHDMIGVLDQSVFDGGDYTAGISSVSLLQQIFAGTGLAPIPLGLPDVQVYGILRAQSRRDALRQLLMAAGAIITTDGRGWLCTGVIDTNGPVNRFGPDRTFPDTAVERAPKVTEVRVTGHRYRKVGDQWEDDPTVYKVVNPSVTDGDEKHVIEITDATLVDSHNAQAIAQRLYDYYNSRVASTATVVWDNSIRGSRASFAMADGQSPVGNISKIEIKLSNTIVATVHADDEVISNDT